MHVYGETSPMKRRSERIGIYDIATTLTREREGERKRGCIRSVYMLYPLLRHHLTLHTCGLTEQAQQSCGHGNTRIRHAHRPLNPVPPRPLGASLRPIFAARFT